MSEIEENEILEAAAQAGTVRVPTESERDAFSLRHRLNRQRSRARKAQVEIYGAGSGSPWDDLVLTIDGTTVVIRKRAKLRVIIEPGPVADPLSGVARAPTVVERLAEPFSVTPANSAESDADEPIGLCEWCGGPSIGPYCCDEHEQLASKAKPVVTVPT